MRGIPRAAGLLLVLLAGCGGPPPPPVPADASAGAGGYEAFLWCFDGEIPDAGLLRRLGVTGVNLDGHMDPALLEGTGLRHYVGHAAGSGILHLRSLPEPGERPVRPHCLSDPKVLAKLGEAVAASVAGHRGSNPFGYALDDEVSIARGVNPVDYCFSVHCMDRMRAWLEAEYRTIERLNGTWGTDFPGFAAARPLTTPEIRAREYGKPRLAWNLAPWSDHRRFMDEVLSETLHRLWKDGLRAGMDAPGGVLGLPFPAAFGGHNPPPSLPFREVYDIRGAKMLARSSPDPSGGARPVSTVFPSGGEEAAARYLLWRSFALGDRAAIVWSNREFVVEGRPTDYARWLAPVLRELTGPLGGTLAGAVPVDQGVAILCSPESVRVGWMIDSEEDGDTWPRRLTSYEADHSSVLLAREAAQRLLEDLGVGYRFVTDLGAGDGLREAGVRVLLLPKALSLPAGAEARLRAFVERGGVVLADFATGLFDEHGRGRGEGLLDALFGVRREDGRAREKGGRPDAPAWCRHRGLPVVEPGLRLAGGAAEAEVGGAPAVVRRKAGEGAAVYLNLGLADYLEDRLPRGGGSEIRELVAGLLQEAGIRPLYPVFAGMGGRLDRILTLRYREGEGEILAVLRNHAVATEAGGKAILDDGARSVSRIRIVLPGPREVTNLRTGEEYGEIAVIQDHLLPLEANLYRIR